MESFSMPIVLSIATLVAVVAIGAAQFMRVRKSQHKRNEKPGGMAGPEPNE